MKKIYLLKNTVNNKVYVGCTKNDLEKRLLQHKGKTKYRDSKLYISMLEVGLENFYIELIEEVIDDVAEESEAFWIEHLNSVENGYNTAKRGNAFGVKMREESRQKLIGNSRGKGYKHTEEAKKRIGEAAKGNPTRFKKGQLPSCAIPVIDDLGNIYESAAAASRSLGRNVHAVTESIKKNYKCAGRKFRYLNEE